ncbi:tetratricopeptide repeat protein [Chondrinema litorale]|uniref:tetratricopeptide repeat protein n=1 Tax=Chondrinema litorale TaxID=2994555 RepID=UPI002542CADA|nr:hypothetical protein [Chondrinema litorale]UZR93492.1 hypothetical protein OQ292_16695 [Chondrinema litorale]
MTTYFFWKSWTAGNKILYSLLLLIFFALLILAGYYFEMGNNGVIHWEKSGDLEVVDIVIDRFDKYFFEFTQEADAYLLKEKFLPTDIQIPLKIYYGYLLMLALGSVVILAALPDLSRLGFLTGMAFMILTWALMGFESLRIFYEIYDKLFAMLFILSFCLLSFFFHYLKKGIPIIIRFLAFSLLFAASYYMMQSLSEVAYPVIHLSIYGIALPLVIALLFIILNASEIYRLFIYVTTNQSLNTGKNNTSRFWFITALYFAHVVYIYFHFMDDVDYDIYYIHPVYLFIITAILGIWGLKDREIQYSSFMSFNGEGAFLYLGTGIIAVSAVVFALSTANDPLIEVYEDAVVFTQIGFGVGVGIYMFFNFKDLLAAGKPVYKVYYKPLAFDYMYKMFTAGLVIGALLLNTNFFTYRQAFAGYYNGLGDLEKILGDEYLSKQNYGIATGYDPRNHRSFYSLANLALQANNEAAAAIFFEDANSKKPSPYAFAALGEIQYRKNEILQSILTYQEGIEKCEQNGELYNNLALIFNERNMLPDSVLLHFEAGMEKAKNPEVLQSNTFTLWTKYKIYESLDSVYGSIKPLPYIGTLSNEIVFLNAYENKTEDAFDYSYVPDSILNTPQLCYVYNYAINKREGADSTFINFLDKLIKVENNFIFVDYLKFALANIYYYKGDLGNALGLIKDVYFASSRTNPDFAYFIAGWMMELDEYEKSANYYKIASRRGKDEALLNEAVALSELENKNLAIEKWKEIAKSNKQEWKSIAGDMLNLLEKDSISIDLLLSTDVTDFFRYRYLHYNEQIDESVFEKVYNAISATEIKQVIATERVNWGIKKDNAVIAGKYMKLAGSANISDGILPIFQQTYLKYQAYLKKFDNDFYTKVQDASFSRLNKSDQHYYSAMYFAENLQEEKAAAEFEKAIELNPIKEKYYLEWAAYYIELEKPEKAYEVLLSGVENNSESTAIIKAYILQSLELRYNNFAESMLEELENLEDETHYQEFLEVYNKKLTEVEKVFEDWNN